jgi:uncharacterized protein (TIGR03437 family)
VTNRVAINSLMNVNGAGPLYPMVADGSTAVSGTTPIPTGTTLVTVGGIAASATYIEEPSWSVGVLQINVIVHAGVETGEAVRGRQRRRSGQ